MILVDTGPLVALCDRRDGKHRAAVRDLAAFAPQRLAICHAVLTEACFHLPNRVHRLRLRAFLHELRFIAIAVEDDRELCLDVLDWLTKYADHEPDWADGCLAVLSGRNKTSRVWTYDREFRTTWRRPNGTAIPLATS